MNSNRIVTLNFLIMKKHTLITLVGLCCLFFMSSCKKQVDALTSDTPTFDAEAAKTAIEERSKIFVDAINSKDSVGLANCYTADAKFMQPNDKSIEGRANIKKIFGQWMKGGMPQMSITVHEVWGCEDMVAAENSWTFINQSGKTVDAGKSLEIYKMEDGVWKLHRDCYNSDMPVAK